MDARTFDGSAGDVDHGSVGGGYAAYRQPDPRIAARIRAALGTARTVVNVAAGAGSYEATSLDVTAVEPSASMRARRPAHLSPAVDAVAEQLPFPDDSFDAAMTTFSVHQWSDPAGVLRLELHRRGDPGPVRRRTAPRAGGRRLGRPLRRAAPTALPGGLVGHLRAVPD
ncbi:class I SAM-dependent methyltransferase [Streptomyces sp. GS7]|uniref:class I SAM-dependent methyltransferase n=1 Tax=Streptomyces sp. GS7 TaxID=2692234 RepID=UPI001F1D4A8F|nr:methyltransferase domain-containing protein [Streptomyces sp. GS7]